MTERDNVNPVGKWEFDKEVTSCFANMLERSIPDYKSMRALVYEVGSKFIKPNSTVIDIGCSTGLAVEPFVKDHGHENKFLLIDNSPSMTEACRNKFADLKDSVRVEQGDLWEFLPLPEEVSLVLSIFSLQFMPTAYRQKLISDIYETLKPGGAFIFVEKIISENMDELIVEHYYDMKRQNGYTEEQIQAKRKSLENVLSPLKAEWNVDMLKTAGFKKVDMFWRCLNFCGWIAVK